MTNREVNCWSTLFIQDWFKRHGKTIGLFGVGLTTAVLLRFDFGFRRLFHLSQSYDGGKCTSNKTESLQILGPKEKINQFYSSLSDADKSRVDLSGSIGTRESFKFKEQDAERPFDHAIFLKILESDSLGKIILYAPVLRSTQSTLFDDFQTQQPDLLVLADRQTGGKGRGGNVWTSPPGCLMFSFSVFVRQAWELPFYQYLVSMAVHRALAALAPPSARPALGVQLKWPNDIYAGGAKLGGVLCQSSVGRAGGPAAGGYHLVCGVGINVVNPHPSRSVRDVLSGAGLPDAARQVTRERVLAGVCREWEAVRASFQAQGFPGALADEYLSMWMHSGQRVQVKPHDGVGPTLEATIRGVAPSGFLLAHDLQGGQLELHPDGNSLDMMAGLIYAKRF